MIGHLSYVQNIIKNEQKSVSFAAHYEQHFKSTMSHTDLRKCIVFKLVMGVGLVGGVP